MISALMSNIAMLIYISCYLAGYCFVIQEWNETNVDYGDLETYVILTIAGSAFIQLGLIWGLIKVCSEQPAIVYLSLGTLTIGYALITVGMVLGAQSSEYKLMNPTSFNYIVAEWCAVTGIFLQSMLNAYEHTIEDEVVKEVESTTNNTTAVVNQTQLDKENEQI